MRAFDNQQPFGALCAEYGISRKTGYKWKRRFKERGLGGMGEESRRPHSHTERLEELVVCEIIKLKRAHPHWGPRKIRVLYARKHPGALLPSDSSFKRVLQRAGLIEPRSKRRRARDTGRLSSGRRAGAPNQVWTVDFKGWWRAAKGERVDPLTVRDEYSRMLLAMDCVPDARGVTVRACFERLFEAHGLPGAIRSDNGTPFATARGLLGLSRLSAWWLALGIDLERSRPGCPQDNGAHERLHLDIRRELEAGRIGRDQAAFDLWRHQYNTERPHEALGMAVPAEVYYPSERRHHGTPRQIDYGAMDTRQVTHNGTICYRRDRIPISSALCGWEIGLAPRQDGLVEVWFTRLLLGHIDPSVAAFIPITAAQKSADSPEATGPLAGSATLRRPMNRKTNKTVTCQPSTL